MSQKFSWKSFVSFSLAWSFLIIFISGVVLYIAPPGRVSNWTNWTLMGFTKSGWQAIHTIFSTTFVILSLFHLFSLNWKLFLSYLSSKTAKGIHRKRELLVSIGLIAVVFLGTHFNLQPFKAIMDFGEWTTESWENKTEQAPIPHAELLTLRELSGQYIKLSPDSILNELHHQGFKADSIGQTVLKISELNHVTPSKIYAVLLPGSAESKAPAEGKSQIQGLGRKSIGELARELGKEPEAVIDLLKKNGISANTEDKIRSVAEKSGKTPMEILDMLK